MKRYIIFLWSFLLFGVLSSFAEVLPGDTISVAYKLHGQTRRFKFIYEEEKNGGLTLHWNIVRNLKLWEGSYRMDPEAIKNGNSQSYLMPEDGNHITLPIHETFGLISRSALDELKRTGKFIYNGVKYESKGSENEREYRLIHVADNIEGGEMWILDSFRLPLIVKMTNNPLEIDWEMSITNN